MENLVNMGTEILIVKLKLKIPLFLSLFLSCFQPVFFVIFCFRNRNIRELEMFCIKYKPANT